MAYEKQNWKTGDVITEEKLNHMEDGIANTVEVFAIREIYDEETDTTKYISDDFTTKPKECLCVLVADGWSITVLEQTGPTTLSSVSVNPFNDPNLFVAMFTLKVDSNTEWEAHSYSGSITLVENNSEED